MPKKKKVAPYVKFFPEFINSLKEIILEDHFDLIAASAVYNDDKDIFKKTLEQKNEIGSKIGLKKLVNIFQKNFSKTQLFKKQYQTKNLCNVDYLYNLLVKSKNKIELSSIDESMINAVYQFSKIVILNEPISEAEALKSIRSLSNFITAKPGKIKLDHLQEQTLLAFSIFNSGVYLENSQDIDLLILNKIVKKINTSEEKLKKEWLIDHAIKIYGVSCLKSLHSLDYKRGFEMAKKSVYFIHKFCSNELQGCNLLKDNWLVLNSYFDSKEFANKSDEFEGLKDVNSSMYDLFDGDFSDKKQTKKNINSLKTFLNYVDNDLKKISDKLLLLNKFVLSSCSKLLDILNLSRSNITELASKYSNLILEIKPSSDLEICNLYSIKSHIILLSEVDFEEKISKMEFLLEQIINENFQDNDGYYNFSTFMNCLNYYIDHLYDNSNNIDGKNMVNRVYHKLMDKYPHMKHHKCPALKSFEVILIDDFPAEKIKENLIFLKEVSSISTLMENLKDFTHKTYLKKLQIQGDFEAIKKYLSDAKLSIYNKEQTDSILSMLERLLQGPEIEEESQNEPGESKISILDFTGNIEDIADQLTYKEIHQYFQNLKALNKPEFTLNPSWIIDNNLIQSKDDMIFKVSEDHDIFAKISSKLLRKLDANLVSEFVSALEKGIIFRNKGQNGIKIINKKLFELKIDGDLRLYTNKIYENSDNEKLIIFDHKGNHNDISKIASSINYELVKVESEYINFSDVSSSSSDEEIIDEVHVMGNQVMGDLDN